MRIGIDLLWVRPGKNGGTESYIRNVLDGFLQFAEGDYKFVLFVSKDNGETFSKYSKDMFETVVCPVETDNFIRRVIWENMHLSLFGKKEGIDIWFMPVYSIPFFMGCVPTVTVIHDLQAIHYPEYFSKFRNLYFRMAWKNDCKRSTRIITISEFCKRDIIEHYKVSPKKITVIYNPIIALEESEDFAVVSQKYGIKKNEYYYTVSSLAKHKNLITILKALRILKVQGQKKKLVISGVKVNAEGELFKFIEANDLQDSVVYTGFVSNRVRNALYDNCKKFLFPSVFEGFGMPPLEAMIRGVSVLTTKEASLYEVTEGKAEYVNDPYDEAEWAIKMNYLHQKITDNDIVQISSKYRPELIANMYIETIVGASAIKGH